MNLGTSSMLLLFPLVALAGWLMTRGRRLQREAACRLKGIEAKQERGRLRREDWFALAALVCVVLALARPQWNPRPYDIERRGRDLVIVLDVSRSMLAKDVFPNRLEAARIAIHEALPTMAGERLALVTFAGSASVRVPLTLDHEFVRYMLERAAPTDVDVGSTSLQAAFEKVAGTVLTDAAGGARDVVVFTDGEDHLSDLGTTGELLAQCGARVLIIGLGDPSRGARVPDPLDENEWMRHNSVEVVSRLDDATLSELADRGSNVTYFSARTRPFDFVSLYRQLISGEGDAVVVGGLRQVRYTEGYPFLLALAVGLWLVSQPWKPAALVHLVSLVLLVPGCNQQRTDDMGDVAYRTRIQQGAQLLQFAQEQTDVDVFAERSLLVDAREEFLRAALLRPGDIETARQITTISRRLGQLEVLLEQRREDERQRRKTLAELIRSLQQLTARQNRLAQQSRRILRRPIPSGEEANLPESVASTEPILPQEQLHRLAATISSEQQTVHDDTAEVLGSVAGQRDTLRQMLKRAYGDVANLPATEIDPVVDYLTAAIAAQVEALASLAPEALRWPQANTSLHTAAGRMQQALDALRSLQPPATDEEDAAMASHNVGDSDADIDGLDAASQDDGAQPASPADFQEALSLRALPIPRYTSEEILAEEVANQNKRAREKAARAAAKVEKNW